MGVWLRHTRTRSPAATLSAGREAVHLLAAWSAREDDPALLRLPGSDRAFTITQIQAHYDPADWYLGEHPSPVPDIVQHGRESDRLRACAHCHYHNGQGKPENGHVTGPSGQLLPAAARAVQERRTHERRSQEGESC